MKQESPPKSQQEIDDIISKFRAIIAANGIQIQPTFLDSTDPHQISCILKQYSEHSINFGQKSAQRYIEQTLQSAIKNFGLNLPQLNQYPIDKSKEEYHSSQASEMIQIKVNKERQIEYDRQILREWKDARIQFYSKSLSKEEDNNKMTSQQQIEEYYLQKSKECLPIQSIIQNKIKGLKVIRIQYTSSEFQAKDGLFQQQYCYEISAFKLFQVVHQNKLLTEVTLKGVMVKDFQDFLEKNKAIKDSEDINLNQQSWIKDFFPLKQLKLSINTIVKFSFPDSSKDLNNFLNLKFFAQMFLWLSDITAKIIFKKLEKNFAAKWSEILHNLFKQLKKIKSIKIQVDGWDGRKSQEESQEDDKYDFIRSLFGELSLFTEISSLSFKWIIFDQQTTNNYFAAFEQSLDILFSNNSVQNLRLCQCMNFPVLPQITTLKSIELKSIIFRKDIGFIDANLANPILKFIKFTNIRQQCLIGQQMFNQLQVLSFQRCQNIKIATPAHRTPSNIKYLQFQPENIQIFDLRTILLKLNNLKYLNIMDIDCRGQVLCAIPSPSLDELHIYTNNTLTNQDLLDIDLRWPQLRNLTLYKCSGLTEDVWTLGNFRGLMQITPIKFQSLQKLKRKGITNFL